MRNYPIKSPVFIIGPPRSGTTLLAKLISSSGEFFYLEEPNVIWRYKNFVRLGYEDFTKSDADSEVVSYIRDRFSSKFCNSNKNRFLEKTPSNCVRIDFVKNIFPDAKFVFLYRDLSEISVSIENKWLLEKDNNADKLSDNKIARQLRIQIRKLFDVPLCDIFSYVTTVFSEISFSFFGRKRKYWGVKYRGYKDNLNKKVEEQAFIQAYKCVLAMVDFVSKSPEKDYFIEVNYNDLLINADYHISRIEDFLCIQKGGIDRAIIKSLDNNCVPEEFNSQDWLEKQLEKYSSKV